MMSVANDGHHNLPVFDRRTPGSIAHPSLHNSINGTDGFLHREDGVKVYETLNFEVQDLLVCDNARTRQEICPCVITLIEAYSI